MKVELKHVVVFLITRLPNRTLKPIYIETNVV